MDYKSFYEMYGHWDSAALAMEITLTEEQRFQFIKARLIDEVVAGEKPEDPHAAYIQLDLADK